MILYDIAFMVWVNSGPIILIDLMWNLTDFHLLFVPVKLCDFALWRLSY